MNRLTAYPVAAFSLHDPGDTRHAEPDGSFYCGTNIMGAATYAGQYHDERMELPRFASLGPAWTWMRHLKAATHGMTTEERRAFCTEYLDEHP